MKELKIPTASAILMFLNPKKYPIIDTRVWQVLWDFGIVRMNKPGKGFTLKNWEIYLKIISGYIKTHKKSARHIEKVLYSLHTLTHPVNR